MVRRYYRKSQAVPRKRKSDPKRPSRVQWRKLSLPEMTLDAIDLILTARTMDERDVHMLVLDALRRLPEYPDVYDMLKGVYDELPPPIESE